jgi:hypothetical protein
VSIKAIGSGIKTNLGSVTGLKHIYAPNELPESVNEFPAAVIQHVGTAYGISMGGDSAHDRHDFTIKVLLTNQDQPTAFNALLDYLARTGDNSIVQKLRADKTLAGSASGFTVISNSGQSLITWGGVQYLGTEFSLEVYE